MNKMILILGFIVLLTGIQDAVANKGGEWIGRASLNGARQETGAARIRDEVYVVGGLLSSPPLRSTSGAI